MKKNTNPLVYTEIIELAREADEYGRKDDACLWKIGDELIRTCGAPGKRGVNNKSGDKMRAVANELEQEGLSSRFGLSYLKKIRITAHNFPHDKRLASVPWAVHDLAGNPDNLAKMLEKAESDKKRLTSPVAKKIIAQRNHAKKVNDKKLSEKDADAALRGCLVMAKDGQTSAIKLSDLANDAGELISAHLPKLKKLDRLIKEITTARDDAAKAVKAWDKLLQKVSAVGS